MVKFWVRSPITFVLTGLFLLTAALPAEAELYTPLPSHNCLRPVKPLMFFSPQDKNQYIKDVEIYMNCLKKFVEEQKEAIRSHQQEIQRHKKAAEAAIEEWNDFAKGLKELE